MYGPNIDEDMDGISNRNTCQKYQNLNLRERLLSHEIPKDFCNKVATDLFVYLNRLYLIVIDYTSKIFELAQLPNASSDKVITHMRSIFARYGTPKVVFSENKFTKFSKSWNFIHKTSNVKFPQSNGFVEIAIQTIKETLRNGREDKNDPYLVMSAQPQTAPVQPPRSCWWKGSCEH